MRISSRGTMVWLLMAALVVSPGVMGQARAPVAGGEPNHPMQGDEITDEQRRSVERGLALLASRQNADGSWGSASAGFGRNAAITALGALAFMQAGNLPGRGRYGENVERALDFILAHTQESGLIVSDTSHGPMYGHGFATLFLAEVYGMTHDERVKEKLQRAVRLIHRTQNPEGGWRYQPVPYDADISVTITQIMALRAAHDAGIRVEREVVDRSIAYVRACQNDDGGFSYMARHGGGSEFPRSAAGVASLYYAGVFEGDEIERGLEYLVQFNPSKTAGAAGVQAHYFYGHYYAVQAMFLAGEEYWTTWYPAIRDELMSRQTAAGGWTDQFGEEYATAMALIILQMPNRYLPVYTGKGPGD